MTRNIIIGIGGFSLFLLNSCGQPSFNRNSTSIKFVEGKPYSIPRGAYYGLVTKGQSEENARLLKHTNPEALHIVKAPLCREGEVRWVAKKEYIRGMELAAKAVKTHAYNAFFKDQYNSYQAGKAGCAKPLNQQEYEYRLNQQNGELNRRAAAKRTSSQNLANTAAAMAPKTVNVNHSGSVDVYRY